MSGLINFVTDNYLIILLVAFAILGVISFVKSIIKWVITVLLIVGLFIYGIINIDTIKEIAPVDSNTQTVESEAT